MVKGGRLAISVNRESPGCVSPNNSIKKRDVLHMSSLPDIIGDREKYTIGEGGGIPSLI